MALYLESPNDIAVRYSPRGAEDQRLKEPPGKIRIIFSYLGQFNRSFPVFSHSNDIPCRILEILQRAKSEEYIIMVYTQYTLFYEAKRSRKLHAMNCKIVIRGRLPLGSTRF